MPRPLKQGILGASTIILSKDILCVVRIFMKQALLIFHFSAKNRLLAFLALKLPLILQHHSSTLIPPQKIKPIFHTTPPEQIHNTCHINSTMI